MAERYGDELAAALPEVDAVVGFAGEGAIGTTVGRRARRPPTACRRPSGVRDLLDLPRAPATAPWAYVKVAEGCDRACAFCAIPSFRGKQRSRDPEAIEAEVRATGATAASPRSCSWRRTSPGTGATPVSSASLAPLLQRLDALALEGLARVRLLYLYPSEVRDPLVGAMLDLPTVVPYFDLSLQHADPALAARDEAVGER